jgi:hypothetical protein
MMDDNEAIRDQLEREIDETKIELLRIDENGEFVHSAAEKREIAERLAQLEARVEEWRA